MFFEMVDRNQRMATGPPAPGLPLAEIVARLGELQARCARMMGRATPQRL